MRRTAETYAGFMPETWLQRTIRGASPCPVPRPLTVTDPFSSTPSAS